MVSPSLGAVSYTHLDVYKRQVDEGRLARQDFAAGGGHVEPAGAINLRVAPPRALGPLHGVGVAGDVVGVHVGGDAPGMDDLVALLLQLAQRDERLVGGVERGAGLFVELAPRGGQRFLVGVVQSLGNRPHAVVLLGPERPAGVGQEYLDMIITRAIKQ